MSKPEKPPETPRDTPEDAPANPRQAKPAAPSDREARLAEALRANLRRRKAPRAVAPEAETDPENASGAPDAGTPED